MLTKAQIEDLPNRKSSLKFTLLKCQLVSHNVGALLVLRTSNKLQKCFVCKEVLEIGFEHVMLFIPSVAKCNNHLHSHMVCATEYVLEFGQDFEAVSAKDTTSTKLSTLARKRRYAARKRKY